MPASWLVVTAMLLFPKWNGSGASDEFAEARRKMVSEQLTGPERAITNTRVLEAMSSVPRHEFVPRDLRDKAYRDHPLPIGHEQTISQPYIVAFMSQALDPKPCERILEVGTGSGYQAAILASIGAEVYSIEIVSELASTAGITLRTLSYTNVHVRAGDGYAGWSEAAPFDGIIVTCAPEKIPEPLVEQLKEDGRMIIPVGHPGKQELVMLRKKAGELRKESVLLVRFVPMTGRAAGLR